jgi:spore coat protein A
MQFRVGKQRHARQQLPTTLSKSFRRLKAFDVPSDATERFVLMAFDKTGAMPRLWEMQEVATDTPAGDGIAQIKMDGGTRTLRRAATVFEDTTTFFAASGTWEKWHLISAGPANTAIYHPMHIHLMNFQVVGRWTAQVPTSLPDGRRSRSPSVPRYPSHPRSPAGRTPSP